MTQLILRPDPRIPTRYHLAFLKPSGDEQGLGWVQWFGARSRRRGVRS